MKRKTYCSIDNVIRIRVADERNLQERNGNVKRSKFYNSISISEICGLPLVTIYVEDVHPQQVTIYEDVEQMD